MLLDPANSLVEKRSLSYSTAAQLPRVDTAIRQCVAVAELGFLAQVQKKLRFAAVVQALITSSDNCVKLCLAFIFGMPIHSQYSLSIMDKLHISQVFQILTAHDKLTFISCEQHKKMRKI
jgi:hypothetical protein